jgi:hypothetical protein
MKDLPHHVKKLNRRVIRSVHREEMEDEAFDLAMPSPPPRKQTERQIKKQAKERMRKERTSRTPTPLNPEERAKKMVKRVPIFDRNSAKPKVTRPTKKKTPRI